MIEIKDKELCTGCHACKNICPRECITMSPDEEGFLYPNVDKSKCINCNLCEKVCIMYKNNINNHTENTKVFALNSKDDEIRKNSSSGGAFTLISNYILKSGGVVFGAMFNEEFEVIHAFIEEINQINKLQGSKYVQSKIGDSFQEVKYFLDMGRLVYFSGTPCQIEGLKMFLRKDYENLVIQDILCHGVPSPKVWKKYIDYRKKIDLEDPKHISFRNKDIGWKNFSMKFEYSNGKEYINEKNNDMFMIGFLRNVFLRPSCYNCKLKSLERNSDITLGDCWEIADLKKEMFDDKGTSFVITHSNKGKKIFDKIKQNGLICEFDVSDGVSNGGLYDSAYCNLERKRYFKNLDKYEFDELSKKYYGDSLYLKIRRIIARKDISKILSRYGLYE